MGRALQQGSSKRVRRCRHRCVSPTGIPLGGIPIRAGEAVPEPASAGNPGAPPTGNSAGLTHSVSSHSGAVPPFMAVLVPAAVAPEASGRPSATLRMGKGGGGLGGGQLEPPRCMRAADSGMPKHTGVAPGAAPRRAPASTVASERDDGVRVHLSPLLAVLGRGNHNGRRGSWRSRLVACRRTWRPAATGVPPREVCASVQTRPQPWQRLDQAAGRHLLPQLVLTSGRHRARAELVASAAAQAAAPLPWCEAPGPRLPHLQVRGAVHCGQQLASYGSHGAEIRRVGRTPGSVSGCGAAKPGPRSLVMKKVCDLSARNHTLRLQEEPGTESEAAAPPRAKPAAPPRWAW